MPALPPTVHERLARCGTRVLLTGLIPGADVELNIDGNVLSFSPSGGRQVVTVPPLAASEAIMARQDEGAGFTAWSPVVTVEDANVPPQIGPRLPVDVGSCSHCVRVGGAVPGSEIELKIGSSIMGRGTANRHGEGCFSVDLSKLGGDIAGSLTATMWVCGIESPPSSTSIVSEQPLSHPVVLSPLFGCQRVVPLDGVQRGARVRIENDNDSLGTFCSCWHRVNVNVNRALMAGEKVRAQPYWDGRGKCIDNGPWSEWQEVIEPDERIAPTIQTPLIEGDMIIRVSGQIVGATRLVFIEKADGTSQDWGPAPSSEDEEIALAEALKTGDVITVTQTLCTFSAKSAPVTVQAPPDEVYPPVIIGPLYECGATVQVSGLHHGALVRLYSNGIPIGIGYAGMRSSISISANPSLVDRQSITASQQVGAITSSLSRDVIVEVRKELHKPRILGPVARGDMHIWVSGLIPGSLVVATSDGQRVGETYVAEPLARIPLYEPADGTLQITNQLCNLSVQSERHSTVQSPCTSGEFTTSKRDVTFNNWIVPATADGNSFTTRMQGEVYFPTDNNGKLHKPVSGLPLIIIAHGFWDELWFDPDEGDYVPVESFRGYNYLGHHLASWGMLVVSVSMDDVNKETLIADPTTHSHAFSRGEIILHFIDEMLASDDFARAIDSRKIGIVGHSMSGEGVIATQHLNRDENRGYQIKGVVSIAPTRYHNDIFVGGSDYLQIFGSMDQLNFSSTGAGARFAGVRFYDQGVRPKTHAWVHGVRHNPFNRRWLATTDAIEESYADAALPASTHELLARCLINAFFQRSVFGRSEYDAYMEGIVLPTSLDHVPVHLQHSRQSLSVIDNFGDADIQLGISPSPLDPSSNTENMSVENIPPGTLDPFDAIELIDLIDSSHDSKAVRFAWKKPGAKYKSDTASAMPADSSLLALRVAQFFNDNITNPPGVDLDLHVTVTDQTGIEATLRLGSSATIPYPDHDLSNNDGPDPLAMMKTISLPADAFTAVAPGLNIMNLVSVTLTMSARPTGHLFMDDMEIWK